MADVMKVRYLGPHDEGFVPFRGEEFLVTRGEVSEVPAELGAILVQNEEQYESAEKARRPKSETAPAADEGDES